MCIPTVFVSYTGEALDYKVPLLKALSALDKAAVDVCHYFDKNVTKVTASIASVTQAVGAVGTCDATDYTLGTPAMTVNAEVPNGNGVGAFSGATIQFKDKPLVNQDGCKGATVNLQYDVS